MNPASNTETGALIGRGELIARCADNCCVFVDKLRAFCKTFAGSVFHRVSVCVWGSGGGLGVGRGEELVVLFASWQDKSRSKVGRWSHD